MKSKPAKANDAWSIKLALHDLDVSLSKQGEMIGALLIVGGEEVVPFHRLPNPVDDADADVPSDNPYATRDENYFVPEWPVGRIPGGAGNNPSLLLQALRSYALHHSQVEHPKPWYMRGWIFLKEHIFQRKEKTLASLGYSAAIWQNASQSVYKPIHERQRLLVSPPVQVCREACDQEKPSPAISLGERNPSDNGKIICLGPQLRPARMGYFNLHGLADAVEWFGHRNPGEAEGGVDYPVALRPMDIEVHLNHGRAPKVIFTEACYGRHIFGKSVEDSIAFKFLAVRAPVSEPRPR